MARNFIEEDEKPERMGYTDGFRFGFGFFIANLLGATLLAGLVMAAGFALQKFS